MLLASKEIKQAKKRRTVEDIKESCFWLALPVAFGTANSGGHILQSGSIEPRKQRNQTAMQNILIYIYVNYTYT